MRQRNIDSASRGISPLLLLLAGLAFLLPMIGVSCNTAASGAAISSAVGNSQQSQQAQQCLSELSGKDLVTYSGTTLSFGGTPGTDAGGFSDCDTGATSTAPSNPADADIGVQPLLIAALVAIVVGIVASALRDRIRPVVAGVAAVVSLVLLIAGTNTATSAILDKLSSSASHSVPNGDLGVAGLLRTFFDIHPAIGYWLILIALVLVILVNAAALLATLSAARSHSPWSTPHDPPPSPLHPPPHPPPAA